MDYFEFKIPEDRKLFGRTAAGEKVSVYPGEYLVHLLRPRAAANLAVLRFVGADAQGRDVHVPLAAAQDCSFEPAPCAACS